MQALPYRDIGYFKNAGAIFDRLLCALHQKRRCGTRFAQTVLAQSFFASSARLHKRDIKSAKARPL